MYRVRWKKSAVNDLTIFWLAADSTMRKAISQASHRMEKELARDPENVGESREGSDRVHNDFPLGILFQVDTTDRIVRVLQVWLFKKRS